ncbi:MAG: hypothetical protein ABIQ58_03960 [Candidatus Limnocylindrales bacterium]
MPAAARATGGCRDSVATDVPQPTAAQLEAAGLDKLPVAPLAKRVDLVAPPFSDPTAVTNPLFPISDLESAVLNGRVDGKVFRTETTLLPDTRVIQWAPGQCIETLVSQYVAYLDGRIEEAALDFYAQADDGSVWYFGEDVHNYRDGIIADTSGTWLAGKEGPIAMIMPATPAVGDVFRVENIVGLVFEEITVTKLSRTVPGPRGPVEVMVVSQLHDDGTFADKLFGPGYGEFFTAHQGDSEGMALGVPVDAIDAPVPARLRKLLRDADRIFDRAAADDWTLAAPALARMKTAWKAHRAAGGVPPQLVAPTERALKSLARAIKAHKSVGTRDAALDVVQAVLDLQLQFRRPAEIDLARSDLWARQVLVDAARRDAAAISGDTATLEWIRDRIARTLDPVIVTRLDTLLEELRSNARDEDLAAAADTAQALRDLLADVEPVDRH